MSHRIIQVWILNNFYPLGTVNKAAKKTVKRKFTMTICLFQSRGSWAWWRERSMTFYSELRPSSAKLQSGAGQRLVPRGLQGLMRMDGPQFNREKSGKMTVVPSVRMNCWANTSLSPTASKCWAVPVVYLNDWEIFSLTGTIKWFNRTCYFLEKITVVKSWKFSPIDANCFSL